MNLRTASVVIAALLCASCGPSLDDRIEDLVTARNVWLSVAAERHYSYQLKFGNKEAYPVSVPNAGTVRENWLVEPECSDFGECRVAPTMMELFQLALELTEDQFHSGGDLTVLYDESMGFPRYIFFDDDAGSHSAFSIEVSNVVFAEE